MGVFRMFSSSSYDRSSQQVGPSQQVKVIERTVERPVFIDKNPPNPDPFNYVVKRHKYVGKFLVMDVLYPDCKNYEGRKFMVYENVTTDELKSQVSLDPHFSSNKRFHSPVARFEPTPEGWERAIKWAKVASEED